MKELCAIQLGKDEATVDYHAIRASEQLERASDVPLEVDLTQMAHGGQVWLDDEASTTYIHAMQIPRLAGDMYTLSSEVLMARATKALVLIALLHGSNGLGTRCRQLADALERLADSEGQLRKVRTQVREMEDELLKLTRAMDALRVDLPKQAVEEYKNRPDLRWDSTV
ncbi:hypothetical protein B296_00008693 [Ensete ventricosum]|uniref:Uncharacterized protein n=1 Tax=Ensete ventricosum TaxID=4639 RepID=A0A426ZCU8_ENSVE|nr:hypothetical protein B296_00008693 [Ensete ventricosum]